MRAKVSGLSHPDLVLVTGLALFGVPYAVTDKAAENVGFYFAANAGGLLGIILSGLLYRLSGIDGCPISSVAMLILCWAITFVLPTAPKRIGLQQTVV